ncbi:MAG: hypothetical protein IKP61_07390, partial [Spirochaetales bacterium]|nr:hypothetical protein [Spirochaetales bacterium]
TEYTITTTAVGQHVIKVFARSDNSEIYFDSLEASIKFTVKAPDNPDNPDNHDNPDNPDNPVQDKKEKENPGRNVHSRSLEESADDKAESRQGTDTYRDIHVMKYVFLLPFLVHSLCSSVYQYDTLNMIH